MKTAIIINPSSGGGRTSLMWAELRDVARARLGGALEEFTTKTPFDAIRLASQVAQSDFDLVIAAGGDGTINEVVNGLFDENNKPINPKLKLGILSAGRGCDFIKSLNLPSSPQKAIDILVSPEFQKIDVGCIYFKDEFGREQKRLFVNIATVGIGGKVAKQVRHTPKFLPPKLVYFASSAQQFFLSKPQKVKIFLDDVEMFSGPIVNVFIANGGYSGGGMCWAPDAKLDDGLFEVIIAEPIPKLTALALQHKLYDGTFLSMPGVHHHKARKVLIDTKDDVLLEVDGEQPGVAPAIFTVLPQALTVATSSSAT
ncbi:MAG: diacylglycerol kinase family lipid kinase [Oligoflexia bacterium]|nr:diacylglycerol kinase family lipid kinase [Oligoflexia bacterium]